MTADLFGEPLIAGLEYRPDFITAAEERRLIAHLSAAERLALVWTLTQEGWTLSGRAMPSYPRHETPITRRRLRADDEGT